MVKKSKNIRKTITHMFRSLISRVKEDTCKSIANGIFLIGLAIVFYFGFWPWILALIGLYIIIKGICNHFVKGKKKS